MAAAVYRIFSPVFACTECPGSQTYRCFALVGLGLQRKRRSFHFYTSHKLWWASVIYESLENALNYLQLCSFSILTFSFSFWSYSHRESLFFLVFKLLCFHTQLLDFWSLVANMLILHKCKLHCFLSALYSFFFPPSGIPNEHSHWCETLFNVLDFFFCIAAL